METKLKEVPNNIENTPLSVNFEGNDISQGLEIVRIRLQNTTRIYKSFQYTANVVCGPGVYIDFKESMYPGCDCVGDCDETRCLCIVRYGPNYDKERRLLKMENTAGMCLPIFECNSNCLCAATCVNRLSQQGIMVTLEVFQTTNRGLGVRTLEPIPKHHFISEYSGEIISYKEAKKRTIMQANTFESNYLLVLKEHVSGGKVLRTHIDATYHGNVARFMNHSCQPNMTMFPVRHNSPVPKLCLFASRNIEAKEELTFSYGGISCKDVDFRGGKDSENSLTKLRSKCLCETSDCAGYLPYEESLYSN